MSEFLGLDELASVGTFEDLEDLAADRPLEASLASRAVFPSAIFRATYVFVAFHALFRRRHG
ncbi:hypothetical protein [Streptomyces sp. 900105245]